VRSGKRGGGLGEVRGECCDICRGSGSCKPRMRLVGKPLLRESRLAVTGGRNEQNYWCFRFGKQPSQPRALDDVSSRRGFAARFGLPCSHGMPAGAELPQHRLVGSTTIFDRRKETSRTRGREGPRVRCRQSPLPERPGARLFESGSSPVSSRYARGICLRRGTPSFCLRTSQCAFAVLGEMPSRSPTSSLEQPAAINSTTCFCRGVRMGGLACSIVDMAPTLTTASSAGY